ncbi:hypothetical protein A2715_00395 [Candidatus Woesebacteria bacterium RIFCSPHIGHO2_01_FULL_39_32]|uniref:Uncharacterized protein n=2 Tax=Candidatus Woeseibacteriota TaxID=1752722 RepID=A0A0G0SYH8_9BACT|nr:MAG: hypothetical protein UT61_C0004G0059 [Candidatus Woesebacteria bacterium GW2011_GWA1_39_8]OGM04121.1 MAG: hypothetical protein A2124_01620 [Candidatus Woesebacteria bacterium GWB1_37_5]OGM24285.1 MAG: hypothetical protein A2715_00395 [Candidatus Woesebacteria bacterium RIFCSPHIGHO2_01_FULL_39_32]OGM35412.1 MAG: hypothetical protein A3F01_04750 [Candidatus Woesebacteria bacterium RIFCSPHIGHO2_12_FULL_38_11]OGM65356.1 MAG: hypothetical protein A2893_01350 [Candidatus Woesebacteria bacteri
MISVNWDKVDKFYIVLMVTLTLLSVMVILTFRGLFSAYITAYEIDQREISGDVRIDKEKLEEAYSWVFTKETLPLEIK